MPARRDYSDRTFHPMFLRTPVDLVRAVDEYAEHEGFRSRTAAVLHLIRVGLGWRAATPTTETSHAAQD